MALIEPGTVHDAVARLYELARCGEIDNIEYMQLDSLVYDRLAQTYEDASGTHLDGAVVQAAAPPAG